MYQRINIHHQEKRFSWHAAMPTKFVTLLLIILMSIYSVKDIHAEETKSTIWVNPDKQLNPENDFLDKKNETQKILISNFFHPRS